MDFFRFNPADMTEGITNKDNLFAGSPRIILGVVVNWPEVWDVVVENISVPLTGLCSPEHIGVGELAGSGCVDVLPAAGVNTEDHHLILDVRPALLCHKDTRKDKKCPFVVGFGFLSLCLYGITTDHSESVSCWTLPSCGPGEEVKVPRVPKGIRYW